MTPKPFPRPFEIADLDDFDRIVRFPRLPADLGPKAPDLSLGGTDPEPGPPIVVAPGPVPLPTPVPSPDPPIAETPIGDLVPDLDFAFNDFDEPFFAFDDVLEDALEDAPIGTGTSAVPEPSAGLLVLAGLCGMAHRRRRHAA